MSKAVKIIGLMAVLLVGAVVVFQKPISSFLFAPEGLSLAAAEICLTNKTNENLVVDISVSDGEKMTILLFPDEMGCAASPEASRKGKIKVGLNEKLGPFCESERQSGDIILLSKFDPTNNCGWTN